MQVTDHAPALAPARQSKVLQRVHGKQDALELALLSIKEAC